MSDTHTLSLDDAWSLSVRILESNGFSPDHARAIARTIWQGQRDECHSHGLYRLLVCTHTLKTGKVSANAVPELTDAAPGLVRVDARGAYSLLAYDTGRPVLIEKARKQGIAALAINHCYHFSALWPEVEAIAAEGLVALAMTPSHSWVAPHGGTKGVFGTNPLAFAWPRPEGNPFVFDFATSAAARGEIELHRRAGKAIPEGWAVDSDGQTTTDAEAAMKGAMLTFGGHKGSALSAMIELMAGPLIGDFLSLESQAYDAGAGATPYHGELILAIDPKIFMGADHAVHSQRAEALFDAVLGQGARLPSQRRYEARARSEASGTVTIPQALYDDLQALISEDE
ncbi:Ldh family oxidoreductase [Asticcacaulis benevestitus]|uniref:Oxidoreductase n=1 Tax=Asticcacaulis benevestitus DSM 16100 = ATCC BAA-896 TaxID=1121022 RepID=V4Q040_9CAUL|nr:Ldh family oxidoreductase [Asticcacaulis benevestitus]ESQ94016.1 oxidoreductase [Asticcacaulis benevestitus DSM 16100 = ATCC BAA-896]